MKKRIRISMRQIAMSGLAVMISGVMTPGARSWAGESTLIQLPPPQTDGGKPLMQALGLRATSRAFDAVIGGGHIAHEGSGERSRPAAVDLGGRRLHQPEHLPVLRQRRISHRGAGESGRNPFHQISSFGLAKEIYLVDQDPVGLLELFPNDVGGTAMRP